MSAADGRQSQRPTDAELRRLYVDERLTHAAIGQRYIVPASTAKGWCKRAGLVGARERERGEKAAQVVVVPAPPKPAKRGATTATGRPIARLDPASRAVVDGWLAGFRAHCERRRELAR
jgi:hypothetical protein